MNAKEANSNTELNKKNDSSPTNDQFNFNEFNLESASKKTDILSQLPSYNKEQTEAFIRNIENEIDEQKTLNRMLTDSNYSKHTKDIESFTKDMNPCICEQVERISKVYKQLKDIVNQNEELKEEKNELNHLITSQECNELAGKLRELKSIKSKIKGFLEEKGLSQEDI